MPSTVRTRRSKLTFQINLTLRRRWISLRREPRYGFFPAVLPTSVSNLLSVRRLLAEPHALSGHASLDGPIRGHDGRAGRRGGRGHGLTPLHTTHKAERQFWKGQARWPINPTWRRR
jgi:hypothetical protein